MTLRDHILAIRDESAPTEWIADGVYDNAPLLRIYDRAVAALAILDARTAWWCDACRELSYDPEEHADCDGGQRRVVLAPDPEIVS